MSVAKRVSEEMGVEVRSIEALVYVAHVRLC